MTPDKPKCKLCCDYGLVQQFGEKPPAEWVPCPAGCPQPEVHEGPLYTGPAPWSGLPPRYFEFPAVGETITRSAGSFIDDGWLVGNVIRIQSPKKGVQFWAQHRRSSRYAAKRWAYLVRHGLAYVFVGKVTAITEDTLTVAK